jgi:hypothetical protein
LEITGVPDSAAITCFSAVHAGFGLAPRRFRTGHAELSWIARGASIAAAFLIDAGIEGREATERVAPSASKPFLDSFNAHAQNR